MTDRDYLRSLGFTVGERGRFSKEMVEALANRNKDDSDNYINSVLEAVNLTPRTPVRDAQELHGYTVGGYKVQFITCSVCAEHMIWCECPNGITAPDNVAAVDKRYSSLVRLHPRMVH